MSAMIFCRACGKEVASTAHNCPACGAPIRHKRYKDKIAAAILAFFGGSLGLHRFYLGQWWGIFYPLFCCTGIPAFIAFIEFIVFLACNRENWDAKYNDGQTGDFSDSVVWVVVGVIVSIVLAVAFLVIIPIMAAIALPAYQDYTGRALITPAYSAASAAATSVGTYYQQHNAIPTDIATAGYTAQLPQGVESITVNQENGTLTVNFNKAPLLGKTLELVPTADAQGAITWACSSPDIRKNQLPVNCRE